ncbi:ankyrin repeat protein, partial [Ancylostoma ceylanicum]
MDGNYTAIIFFAQQFDTIFVLKAYMMTFTASPVMILIDAGSDINVENLHGQTALDLAVRRGHLGAVKVLLNNKALIESKKGVSQATALHVAAKKGYHTIVRLLLGNGATIDRRDDNANTALDIAIIRGHRDVARVLVEADDWRKIMISKDRFTVCHHHSERSTPIRSLIQKFPDVAKIAFDRCVEEVGGDSQPDYEVKYDFSVIEDTYMMPTKDSTDAYETLSDERSPYHGDGRLKKRAKMYSQDHGFVYERHPLKLM